jgi:hypothetical protein
MRSSLCVPAPYVPIQPSEILSDDELISIANQFLQNHNVSTSAYGQPEVNNEYRIMYERAVEQKQEYYLPEAIPVVYPLLINNETVYDESGNKVGLNVTVNVRNKKVVGIWDLSMQNYTASSYDAETDVKRIMSLVEKGGAYGWVDPDARRTIEVQVGDPKLELVRMWDYQNNQSSELLVPSLVFTVLEQPDNEPYFYRKAVVVPLIKRILDRQDGGSDGGPVKIFPAQ